MHYSIISPKAGKIGTINYQTDFSKADPAPGANLNIIYRGPGLNLGFYKKWGRLK